jgi:hypothetical protein
MARSLNIALGKFIQSEEGKSIDAGKITSSLRIRGIITRDEANSIDHKIGISDKNVVLGVGTCRPGFDLHSRVPAVVCCPL